MKKSELKQLIREEIQSIMNVNYGGKASNMTTYGRRQTKHEFF